MPRPIRVEPREGHTIWIEYDDGASGVVDLSHHAGLGVFAIWSDRAVFEAVRISEHQGIAWSDDAELCPDALYMDLTGKTVEEIWPALAGSVVDA